MKYYDEEQMASIRENLEAEVLRWPGVSSRPMMGCLCYFRGRKFFAFLVTGGIVINKLSSEDRVELTKQMGGKPFRMAGKPTRLTKTNLTGPKDVGTILPFVKKSYENAVEH